MHLDFKYGFGRKTQNYYKKLIVAKANEVISGGDKYYSNLVESYNVKKVADYVKKHSPQFETELDYFITRRQMLLEKRARGVVPTSVDPIQRSHLTQAMASKAPECKELQPLANIYKYFAEKSKSEHFIG